MYRSIDDLEMRGKRVLVRLDLNVPLKDSKVADMTRIDAVLPTIKSILEKGGIPILCSHLGRPGGKRDDALSLAPVAKVLGERLRKEVVMAPDCIGEDVERLTDQAKPGDIILLENLRFHEGEEKNAPEFTERLAELADVYVNDAFGTAHRAHASTYGVPLLIKKHRPVAAGLLMASELEIWKPVVEAKEKKVAVIGGAKLKEKMKAVDKLSQSFQRVIVGGVVANVFMKAANYPIGCSRCSEKGDDYQEMAGAILDKARTVVLPEKVVVAKEDFTRLKSQDPKEGIEEDLIIADVLPSGEDIKAIKEAKVVVWFGPLGAYERGFTEGSQAMVDAINGSEAYAVVGGGDVAAATKGVKAKISTGGGAAIIYIASGRLEALEALRS